jgi:hypothetical protein
MQFSRIFLVRICNENLVENNEANVYIWLESMYACSIVCHERKLFRPLHTWKKQFLAIVAENPHTIHHYMHNTRIYTGEVIRLRKICLILENMLEAKVDTWMGIRMEWREKISFPLCLHTFSPLSLSRVYVTWPFH